MSIVGAGLGWTALVAMPLLLVPSGSWPGAMVIVAALILTGALAFGVARGHLPSGGDTVPAENLVARRGADEPTMWLMAHSDSKGQGTSIAGRVLAVPLALLGGMGLVVLSGWRIWGVVPWPPVVVTVVAAVLGGAVLSRSRPTNASPGAVDNASGLIALLAAADALAHRTDVGLLITDAEEFGMLGAVQWASGGRARGPFVNFDSIDSTGKVRVMVHRTSSLDRQADRLAQAIRDAIGQRGTPSVAAKLPLGIMVDGGPMAAAGHPGVTVSRGDWSTLRVVHTKRDRPERVDPVAAIEIGHAVAVALGRRSS